MAVLEGGHKAVHTPTGTAAIALAVLSFVKAGDHILVTDSLFPPTRNFIDTTLKRLGVEAEYYSPCAGADIAKKFRPNTSLLFMESPGSGTFCLQDVPALCKAAKKAGITTVLDNSWATGLFFRAFEKGVNVSLISATKYISGHADVNLGAVVADCEDTYKTIKSCALTLGMAAAPEDMYLALRGLRTMKLRLESAEKNAMKIVKWVEARPEVKRVFYPALPGHPGHDIWKRDFKGANGIFSFMLRTESRDAVKRFCSALKLFPIGDSWGGYESLLQPQFIKRCRSAVPWEDDCWVLRLQIGLEDPDDLIADLDQAFAALNI